MSNLSRCLVTAAWIFSGLRGFAQSSGDYQRAVAEFQAGHYVSGEVLFARVEAAAPGTTDALLYRAKCLVHYPDFNAAERALRSYLQSHPDSSEALYMLGFVLNREDRAAESLAVYSQAARITPPSSDDLKIVGLNYVLVDDYPDAIRWLEKAVALDPKNRDTWYYLGRVYYTQARLGDARRAFETVLRLDPRNAKAENNLGLILETEGKPAGAIEAYRQAIAWQEHNSEKSEQPYVNLGNLLAEQGRTQEAVGLLETAAALAPNNAYCHMTLGVYYRKLGKIDQARRELEKATQLEPDNAIAHYQLGRLYREMNKLDLARAEFDRTAALKARASKPVWQSR